MVSPYRSMARSARLANGVNEVVGRRSQTAVQGRFRLFAIYANGRARSLLAVCNMFCVVFRQGRFLLSTVNRSTSIKQATTATAAANHEHTISHTAIFPHSISTKNLIIIMILYQYTTSTTVPHHTPCPYRAIPYPYYVPTPPEGLYL